MKILCEVIRDLMPLYVDDVASGQSRQMVEGHIAECDECSAILSRMKNGKVEEEIESEKTEVMEEQKRVFRRKSAVAGGVIAGIFMIPILVCLIVNLASGAALTWFYVVLASLITAASLTVVPLTVPENKGLWTLFSFTVSLLLLLGVCCIYSGGDWFLAAGSSALFGIGVVFLPFAVRSTALSGILKSQKALAVMSADTVLYALMMLCIGLTVKSAEFFKVSFAVSLPVLTLAWALFTVIRYMGKNPWTKAGVGAFLCSFFGFFSDNISFGILGQPLPLPAFSPKVWDIGTVDGNIKWICLIFGTVLGAAFVLIGIIKKRRKR